MRKLLVVGVLLLLAGCGQLKDSGQAAPEPIQQPVTNKQKDEVESRDFHITFESAKETYKLGEKIELVATLTNISEEPIEIGHGESWILYETTDISHDYRYGAVATEPYITQVVQPGASIERVYSFSGASYDEALGGNKYSDAHFEKMASMKFPRGQYEIKGHVNFEDLTKDATYKQDVVVVFTVE